MAELKCSDIKLNKTQQEIVDLRTELVEKKFQKYCDDLGNRYTLRDLGKVYLWYIKALRWHKDKEFLEYLEEEGGLLKIEP